jgi:cobalamin biosynthesis protein CobD/CbiB
MVKRVLALAAAIALIVLVIATFILGVTGSDYFMGMLFLCILIPILLWAMALVARLLREKGESIVRESEEQDNNN